jgi:CRP-like cAMP-binding protein
MKPAASGSEKRCVVRRSVAPTSHVTPQFRAIPFLKTDADTETIRLTTRQREQLAQLGVRVRVPPRKVIYREDSEAQWVFAVIDGAVKCYRELPSGKRALCAFLFAKDLFGLAEQGRYLNSAQAIGPVTLYRFPLNHLTFLLKQDAELQFKFLAKVTQELRESQRRAILISRRDATGRFAMFLALMSERADKCARDRHEVPLPMSRSDIADFLGLSLETVSRATADLERRGLVEFENRHLARIIDRARLSKLAAAV